MTTKVFTSYKTRHKLKELLSAAHHVVLAVRYVRTYVCMVLRAVVAHVPCAHRLVCKVHMCAQYDKGLSG